MDELCEILVHKLTLMNSQKEKPLLSNKDKDQMLDSLLIEKKKQSLRSLVQSRLQQAVASRHFRSQQEIKQIVAKSYAIMNLRTAGLRVSWDLEPLEQLVELYRDFFKKAGGTHKVEEIDQMYNKRLCPKSLIPSTLFNWLVEWVRKQFKQFLKNTIHSLYVSSRQSIPSTEKQKQKEKDKDKDKKDEEKYKGEIKPMQIVDPFMIVHKKSVLSRRRSILGQVEKKQTRGVPRSLEELRLASNRSQSKLQKMAGVREDGPINQEVFLYSYADQLQNLYKSLEDCVPDLDAGWARRLKRGSRREQVLRRVPDVAVSTIKHMPLIKESIEAYAEEYRIVHEPKKPKSPKKTLKTETIDRQKSKSCMDSQILKRRKKKKQINQSSDKASQIDRSIKIQKVQMPLQKNQREISTSEHQMTRRQELIFQLNSRNRYDDADSDYGSESNLIPSSVRKPRRQIMSYDMSQRTIDVHMAQEETPRILWINTGKMSNELEIIEERVKKMKMKVLHGRPIKGSVFNSSATKQEKYEKRKKKERTVRKTIQFDGKELRYRSLPVSISLQQKEIKLPKIRKGD